MDVLLGIVFLCTALLLIVLILLIIFQTGFVRLESAIGIAQDGIPAGKAMPAWSLPDLAGQLRTTPTDDHWQFLIFADYALGGFPDLIVGMQYLASTVEDLDVLVLSRDSKDVCEAVVRGLNLRTPVVPVEQAFYDRCRVRVMPFAFLLDPQGTVRWTGVVNTKALLAHVWNLAQAAEFEGDSLEEVKR